MQIEREVTAVKQNDDIVQRMFVLLLFFVFAESLAKSSAQSVHDGARSKYSVPLQFNQQNTASEPATSKNYTVDFTLPDECNKFVHKSHSSDSKPHEPARSTNSERIGYCRNCSDRYVNYFGFRLY